jgi:hypothetical protein
VARNEFIYAWLVVVTLLLLGILAVTLVFVWRSGLLSGQIPLVETTSESTSEPTTSSPKGDPTHEDPLLKATGAFKAIVFCVDPTTEQLVPEDRTIADAPHMMGKVLNVLGALRSTPTSPNLQPAVPPEIQFRSVFYDRDAKTVYIDIAKLPESWSNGDPVTVGLCLYSVVHTVNNLGSDFQFVRFLVDGKEPESSPGGVVLSELFAPSEDWLGTQPTN